MTKQASFSELEYAAKKKRTRRDRFLAEKGLMLREGTIVDATLIAAPPSTKNREGKQIGRAHV